MIGRAPQFAMIPSAGSPAPLVAIVCLLLCGGLAAQNVQNYPLAPLPEAPAHSGVLLRGRSLPLPADEAGGHRQLAGILGDNPSVTSPKSQATLEGPRRITLEEAQAQARAADNPMARLAQLQVEAARQHRLGAQSDYFPKVTSTFANLHFNKFMGEEIALHTLNGEHGPPGCPWLDRTRRWSPLLPGNP